jgi:nitrate reductase assembly molybdenum cofactor insertion protein NarJ
MPRRITFALMILWYPLFAFLGYQRGTIDTNNKWTARFTQLTNEFRALEERVEKQKADYQNLLDALLIKKALEAKARRT